MIIIYGTGKTGESLYELLCRRGADEQIAFFDSDSSKWGGMVCGKRIVSLDEINSAEVEKMIIASTYYHDILANLADIRFDLNKLYYYDSFSDEIIPYYSAYGARYYSQDGEDIWLRERFSEQKAGFYVDVGALHPLRFSNTAWAYQRGWRGINIEPNPDLFKMFQWIRPRDINYNVGISDEEAVLEYYMYDEPAYNGFDRSMYKHKTPIKTCSIEVKRLEELLKANNVKHIDYISIDVEGMELNVLNSIDWSVDVSCFLIEQFEDIDQLHNTDVYCFMHNKGYRAVAKYGRTVIYDK